MPSAKRATRASPAADESELIDRARAGDPDASESLAKRWWSQAYATAAGVLGDVTSAGDVAQEAVLAALDGLGGFEPGRPASPWITKIATNKALDLIRRESRRREAVGDVDDAPSTESPGELLELVDALRDLSPRTRAMLVLHHLGGFSSAEIAETLGTKPGTVRSAMSRAIDRSSEEVPG